ncbi:phytanoyl-CoA dioxygenase family protein [Winogradskyella aurantiaca]|uniref:phytanoyl-CoA dioxygenase family protein n=1 Tax=Winogradskyella aurantiaca TaxID=2219558 RepID=UPI000E1C6D07|nr:phytanoyl-CoA dioxygenase family protein [Winogradskyella aurantiaca]
MLKKCKLTIDDQPFEFEVEGDFFWGKPELLYPLENNILSNVPWERHGYACVDALNNFEIGRLKKSVKDLILEAMHRNNIKVDADFELRNYHKYATSDQEHSNVISITRNLQVSDFDFDIDNLAKRFSKILGWPLTSWVEELNKSHVQIRISRPNSLDINPPHRDGYLSYWADIVNVWLPIEGCNNKSSLPVFPGSHLVSEDEIFRTESKGATIKGNVYYVPCIIETKQGIINMIRPNPKEGQALLFSPYLIHGAAVNQNKDITRISLELRFPKANS